MYLQLIGMDEERHQKFTSGYLKNTRRPLPIRCRRELSRSEDKPSHSPHSLHLSRSRALATLAAPAATPATPTFTSATASLLHLPVAKPSFPLATTLAAGIATKAGLKRRWRRVLRSPSYLSLCLAMGLKVRGEAADGFEGFELLDWRLWIRHPQFPEGL